MRRPIAVVLISSLFLTLILTIFEISTKDSYGYEIVGIPSDSLSGVISLTFIILVVLGYNGTIKKIVIELQKYGKNKLVLSM